MIPGIGADERLFAGQRQVRDIRAIPRLSPEGPDETLRHYAERSANSIRIDGPFDLGGASFGGMIALEMARHSSPERVFLFGSCRSPKSIAPSLRALRHLLPLLPDRLLHPPRVLHSTIARWFGAHSSADIRLFNDMLAATPVEYIRWASRAVFSWEGVADLPMPVCQIHGDRDRLIPHHRVHPDRLVSGAGHLLNLTHAGEVNAFIGRERE